MILTGSGQNIYPEEIEEMINQIPGVVESLVVGRNHAIIALIVVDTEVAKREKLSLEALQETINENVIALNKNLPPYSQIGRCEFRTEPFEKTPKLSIKRFMYN